MSVARVVGNFGNAGRRMPVAIWRAGRGWVTASVRDKMATLLRDKMTRLQTTNDAIRVPIERWRNMNLSGPNHYFFSDK